MVPGSPGVMVPGSPWFYGPWGLSSSCGFFNVQIIFCCLGNDNYTGIASRDTANALRVLAGAVRGVAAGTKSQSTQEYILTTAQTVSTTVGCGVLQDLVHPIIHTFATFALLCKKRKSCDSHLPLLPFCAKSANPVIHTFATFALLCKKCKSRDSHFCHFCPFVQKVQIPLLPLLPFCAKSANPVIHTFATFALLCKKCKSRDSHFCHFCPFVQKVQIPLLPLLPFCAKVQIP